MPPLYNAPSGSGRIVGALLAVVAGLLLGGIVGLAIHDSDEDAGTAEPVSTSTTLAGSGDTSTTGPGTMGGTTTSTTSTGGGSTTTVAAGVGTTTSTTAATTSPTTVPRGGVAAGGEEELAHTGPASDLALGLGLGLVVLALAARRASSLP
ncbi:MAG: hypothetical protein ACRD0S_11985 [Acidimicrobiales bacterium]